MSAVKDSSPRFEAEAPQEWERTPRWAFWRPAWRRMAEPYARAAFPHWEYQTHRQRAREALEEEYA